MFINDRLEKFESIEDVIKNKSSGFVRLKEIISKKPVLEIFNGFDLVCVVEDIQPLYLFPTSILDYVNAWKKIKENKQLLPVEMFVSEINNETSFEKVNKSCLKNVEFLLDEKNLKYSTSIKIWINSFFKDSVYTSLNIKKLCDVPDELLKDVASKVQYFKVFLPNILTTDEFDLFLEKLKVISENKNKNALVHIKSYLNEQEVSCYKMATENFENLKVDIFQVSKELIPLGLNNVDVNTQTQTEIRLLEKLYDGKSGIKFLSVKDISTLYYPRFELDERNTKNCMACVLRPYVYGDKVLPCKVRNVLNNSDDWKVLNLKTGDLFDNFTKCGTSCDDCASMFENDVIQKIDDLTKDYDLSKLKFMIKVEG